LAPLRIWALTGARAGDNDQVIALAEAIGLPFEVKQLRYNPMRRLGPRLLGSSLLSLTNASRGAILSEPTPDLTISAGHRSVAVVRMLRRVSRGRTRSIHIGFPRVSPGHFDLVITTPQYPVADHPNVLRLPYAFTRAAVTTPDPEDCSRLAELPSPRRLLIIGGPNVYWKLDEERLVSTLKAMTAAAQLEGGSVLATTSPRTPDHVRCVVGQILSAAQAPALLTVPRKPPSYASLLQAADSIHVTADSVAMVSDAIWTGKPVALIPVATAWLGRAAMRVIGRSRALYPQDLRAFWKALADIGISESLATPRASPAETMASVLERVRPILNQLATTAPE
jgi:hypothetical protein